MNQNNDVEMYEKYSSLLTSEKVPKAEDTVLEECGYLAKNFQNFLSSQSDVVFNQSSILPKLAELIVSFGLVKTFNNSEDRDYDSRDFPFEAENAVKCFEYLNYLLKHYENIDTASKRKFLVQALMLSGTHNSKYFWSSDESVAASKEFLKDLLICSKHTTLNSLLNDDTFHPTIFKAILKWMRPNLLKDTWMKNPSYCHIFYWLLSQTKHPHLVEYIRDILPPPFMFCSYYAVPQQVLGIKCFDHILDNVPPSLLSSDGTEDAIFHTLKKFIYSKDIPVVQALYPCLLKLPMMNLKKADQLQWLQFDVVLQQLLQNVDFESNPKLRHLFLLQMHLFIKATPCFKHLKKSMCVLLQNFTANSAEEEECRIISLKIIKEFIRSCWPRIHNHCYDIMLAILKAIYDTENPSYTPVDTSIKQVIVLCEECLLLLKQACPETFVNLSNEYIDGDSLLPGANLLQKLL